MVKKYFLTYLFVLALSITLFITLGVSSLYFVGLKELNRDVFYVYILISVIFPFTLSCFRQLNVFINIVFLLLSGVFYIPITFWILAMFGEGL